MSLQHALRQRAPRETAVAQRLTGDDLIARVLLIAAALFLLLFLFAPMIAIFMRVLLDSRGEFVGLAHFRDYFATPGVWRSAWNSVWVSATVALITVPLAFVFAYALTRSCMPGKGVFRLIALIPLLSPSLLPAISFIQWFGNQGALRPLLGDAQIYGAPGIIIAQVYNTFPHALMILVTALALADARLYEAADALGTRAWRKFTTITLPACKYGLLSAVTVVFTYVVSDFGAPKVIGGNFNMLAIDVFKQVIGQHDFSRGAVVGLLLLVPTALAFAVDRHARRRLRAQLTARSVPLSPRRRPLFDAAMTAYCALVCAALLAVIGMAVFTSAIQLWPYNLTPTLRHYRYVLVEGDMAGAFYNSLRLAGWTALFGTAIVFVNAYLIEKTRGLDWARPAMHLMAMLSMAVPGLVLGLGYIMFFNHPSNPLGGLYQTMAILVLATVVHYYTPSHLTAVTALQQLDAEFESVSASLKVPFYRTFWRVTVPVCLPALLEIARYFFVVSLATLSVVVFLYSYDTVLASVAIMNLDEAGDVGPAAALATLVVVASAAICAVYAALARLLVARTQRWRAPAAA
ncbi:MAG TPA: putative 2-aminoethylphosphonate ABC transporter permease subunit [Burkholderiaceae bacterium]|nr:putative 2-aminoethylphosphonate ABC transporter permease subunit [Burkholderiaceae bacterium]